MIADELGAVLLVSLNHCLNPAGPVDEGNHQLSREFDAPRLDMHGEGSSLLRSPDGTDYNKDEQNFSD